DGRAEQTGHAADQVVAEITRDHVAAERKRQPARLTGPPFPQVPDEVQRGVPEGQLPLVNDQTGIRATRDDERNDLVEGDGNRIELGHVHAEREVRGGHLAGDGDTAAAQVSRLDRVTG